MNSPRVVVTGGHGFLGWHVASRLLSEGADVRRIGRPEAMDAGAFEAADAVIHCAGVNRGSDEEVREGNLGAARTLIDRLGSVDPVPHRVVYANSTQSVGSTVYGRSKRQAGEELRQFCADAGVEFHEAIVPNVFGEGGRPFYNSFVATFCHQIALGEPCTVIDDRDVTLIHAQDVAEILVDAALRGTPIPTPISGVQSTVAAVLDRLLTLDQRYRSGVFPDLGATFDVDLFNTLRAAVYATRGPVIHLTRNTDPRGWLVETAKQLSGGQTFVSSTVPGITRGRHFHLRKVERFVVIQGDATIEMRRLFSDHVDRYAVRGDEPVAVEIPTLHTHAITNTGGDPLLTLFWANELFDPANSDTFALAIEGGTDR